MERIFKRFKQLALTLAAMFLFTTAAFAVQTTQAPAYNTMISNQASLTYTGYDEESRSLQSNIVIVYVDHLYMVAIYPDATVTLVPGQTANFMHTVANRGNDADIIAISGGFDGVTNYSNMKVYVAPAGTNNYDMANPITPANGKWNLPSIPSGETLNILVTVATGAALGQGSTTQSIYATSTHDSTATASAKETIVITSHAAVTVFKGLSKYEDDRLTDKTITVGLDIYNPATATNAYASYFKLEDSLNSKWKFDSSITDGTTATKYDAIWTDYDGTKYGVNSSATIQTLGASGRTYKLIVDQTTGAQKVTFEIFGKASSTVSAENAVPVGNTVAKRGMLEFNVKVAAVTTPIGPITNTANYSYDDPGTTGGGGSGAQKTGTSNTVSYEVLPTRIVAITDNNPTGYTYIGGQYTYTHTIKNLGDVTEGTGVNTSIFTLGTTESKNGWQSKIYVDTNHNGNYDSGIDVELTDMSQLGGLAAGDSIKVFVHVWAPNGAVIGDVDISSINLDITQGVYHRGAKIYGTTDTSFNINTAVGQYGVDDYKAKDTTMIKGDYLTIEKFQSVDDVAANYTKNDKWIKPGNNIYYMITVTNTDAAEAKAVTVSDIIPAYTTLEVLPTISVVDKNNKAITQNSNDLTSPAKGAAQGTIMAVVPSIPAGGKATLKFAVKINSTKYSDD